MYASLGDLFKDLFGIDISFLYIFQMFGLIMAISFLVAAWLLSKEMRRKEQMGLLHPVLRKTLIGKPASPVELIVNGLIGFIVGFKVVGIILNLTTFQYNPPAYVFSMQGSWIGGIIGAGLFAYSKYSDKQKSKLEEAKWEMVSYHPYQLVGDITIYAAIAGLIGAKLFDNLEHFHDFISHPINSMFTFSGLTFYGGLIFGTAVVIWYCVKNKLSIIHMADAVAPSLIIAYGIGRIGCQVAGDGDWGINNPNPKPGWLSFLPDWLWAYNYPHNVNNEGVPIPGCMGKHCMELQVPVFPTPIYETITCLLIFFFLWSIRKRLKVPGMLFAIYLVLNGIERFLVELIRVNIKYHFLGISPTQAEIIALGMIGAGIGCAVYFNNRNKKQLAVSSEQ